MLKTLLQDTRDFYINNFRSMLAIILPIVIPAEIITGIYSYYFVTDIDSFSEQIIPSIIALISYPIYSLGIILFIASKSAGIKMDLKALFELGLTFWKPYLIIYVLLYLAFIAGLILLIIPGIIIAVRFAFSEYHLIFDRLNPIEAMKVSWNSTKGYRWIIFWGNSIIMFFLCMPSFIFSDFLYQTSMLSVISSTIYNICISFLGVLITIFTFHVFKYSREQNKDAVDFNIFNS